MLVCTMVEACMPYIPVALGENETDSAFEGVVVSKEWN